MVRILNRSYLRTDYPLLHTYEELQEIAAGQLPQADGVVNIRSRTLTQTASPTSPSPTYPFSETETSRTSGPLTKGNQRPRDSATTFAPTPDLRPRRVIHCFSPGHSLDAPPPSHIPRCIIRSGKGNTNSRTSQSC